MADEAVGFEVPLARTAAARNALAESGGLTTRELDARLDDLLAPARDHRRRLELQVDDDLAVAWIAGDTATLLAPRDADLAVLLRVPAAALPVALVGQIPSFPATPERSSEPLALPSDVLADVLATRHLPPAIVPGPDHDALLALTHTLRAWWRLAIADHDHEASARVVEGLHTSDGPWRLVAHGDLVRLEPTRPRELFRTLCAEVLATPGRAEHCPPCPLPRHEGAAQ